jgi:hypothetical protein
MNSPLLDLFCYRYLSDSCSICYTVAIIWCRRLTGCQQLGSMMTMMEQHQRRPTKTGEELPICSYLGQKVSRSLSKSFGYIPSSPFEIVFKAILFVDLSGSGWKWHIDRSLLGSCHGVSRHDRWRRRDAILKKFKNESERKSSLYLLCVQRITNELERIGEKNVLCSRRQPFLALYSKESTCSQSIRMGSKRRDVLGVLSSL